MECVTGSPSTTQRSAFAERNTAREISGRNAGRFSTALDGVRRTSPTHVAFYHTYTQRSDPRDKSNFQHTKSERNQKQTNKQNQETNTMSKVFIITGANSGLGFDATRQLAARDDVAKVYLACRSRTKAEEAMKGLADHVSKDKLAFLKFDGSDTKSEIEKGVDALLPSSVMVDGIVLNAGGVGNDTAGKPTEPNNVLPIVQINIAAHVHFIDYLLKRGNIVKDKSRIIFSGSEGSRGIKLMGMKSPKFEGNTPEYFKTYLDGSVYAKGYDAMGTAYADVKGIGALYFSAWAREHPGVHVLTVSPGGTKGTAFASHGAMDPIMGFLFPYIMIIFGWFGFFHALEVGAKRYLDAVTGEGEFASFSSGSFVASKSDAPSGPVADQVEVFETGKQYGDVKKQNAVYAAVNAFL